MRNALSLIIIHLQLSADCRVRCVCGCNIGARKIRGSCPNGLPVAWDEGSIPARHVVELRETNGREEYT